MDEVSKATITEDECWAELERLQQEGENPAGLTTGEIAAIVKHSIYWVRKRLKVLQGTGRLIINHRQTMNLAGNKCMVPVYVVLPE